MGKEDRVIQRGARVTDIAPVFLRFELESVDPSPTLVKKRSRVLEMILYWVILIYFLIPSIFCV